MGISSVSRIIVKVSEAIARLYPHFVKMPEQEEIIREQNKFYTVASFPRVLGLVDCTHVRIQSPGNLLKITILNSQNRDTSFVATCEYSSSKG